MDYAPFQELAQGLLEDFGSRAVLRKPDGKPRFDENQKKVVQKWIEAEGIAVKTKYSAEAVGEAGGLIKSGDVRLVCRFAEPPTEARDEIEFGGVLYNCIQVDTVEPNGADAVVFIVQGRRS